MKDGRGLYMKNKKEQLTKRIAELVKKHPNMYRKDLCERLDISAVTLRKHLKIINGS